MPIIAARTLTDRDIAAIRGTIDPWAQACIDADWDRLLSLCTDDIVFLPPDAPIVEGSAAVRAFMETFPDIKTFTSDFTHIEGHGDTASARGTFAMTVEADGNKVAVTGKFIDTFRKQPDNSWRYSSVIWNNDEPTG